MPWRHAGANGIVCLTGLSSGGRSLTVEAGVLNRRMVLEDDVVYANRRHYEAGAKALAAADRFWLSLLVTRKVPLGHWQEAYQRRPGDVKTILQFAT